MHEGSRRAEKKIPIGILGATGTVGQRFVTLLAGHPWFELAALSGSDRSAGKRYEDAVRWVQSVPIPQSIARARLVPSEPSLDLPLVFSALDAGVAGEIESAFAAEGALVVSNASSHRMEPGVPLVVPEVNASHLSLASRAGGAILTNPNCSTIALVLALKPLWDRYGLRRVSVVTMQAVSGAGLPGVASYEILDNLVPFIPGEEEKIERESKKILGSVASGAIRPAELVVSAQCNRVPVLDGHTLAVAVELDRKASLEEVRGAWEEFSAEPQELELPSAPHKPVHYLEGESSPQPRLHRDRERGMAVSIGRLRPCALLDFKFTALSHNTLRGAAGGALLLAELAVARGLLEKSRLSSVKTSA